MAQFSLYVHNGGLKPHSFHFISVLDDCCNALTRKESQEIHVEEEEEEGEDEVWGIENKELLIYSNIYMIIVHAVLGCYSMFQWFVISELFTPCQ